MRVLHHFQELLRLLKSLFGHEGEVLVAKKFFVRGGKLWNVCDIILKVQFNFTEHMAHGSDRALTLEPRNDCRMMYSYT